MWGALRGNSMIFWNSHVQFTIWVRIAAVQWDIKLLRQIALCVKVLTGLEEEKKESWKLNFLESELGNLVKIT